ncbi:MAG: NADH-quinone oxidoreductase subunit C [Candidatus Puniceispirillales bacterium WSBS_2018_MAG_OTU23]
MIETLTQQVRTLLADKIKDATIFRGELCLTVTVEDVPQILTLLKAKNGGGFTQLSELTAVDYPNRPRRFDLIYQLLSVTLNQRIRLKAEIGDGEVAPSVSRIFSTAIWSEREVWDMFGIFFSGHDDLRRLLTDYGFEGHPLRKDFPLTGTVEVRYDDQEKRVIYEPVTLTQEFRNFDFMSPWEGTQTAMRQDDPEYAPKTAQDDE